MSTRKSGPLTRADFEALWTSVAPDGYTRPFLELGEGQGFEAFTQAWAQYGRVSEAVDRSTQALYIAPFSGQTAPPATGARLATVELTFTRSSAFAELVIFAAGIVPVEELQIDFAVGGGEQVLTGRRYFLTAPLIFQPGEAGPITAQAVAEAPGFGYNNPQPGTLVAFVQPGVDFTNDRASILPGIAAHRLAVRPDPDVVIPEHVGQYVEIMAGANAGQRRRVIGYEEPVVNTQTPTGGTLLLAPTMILRISLVAGTFDPGEVVEQASTGAKILVLAHTGVHLLAERIQGNIALGALAAGVFSGAVAVFDAVELSPDMVAETSTATWRILDWTIDFSFSVTNALSPEGGASATLDEAGDDRGIQRRAGETGLAGDESYRRRVGALADTVSPNALSRAANRLLAPLGESGTLREVGLQGFRGLFFEGDGTSAAPEVASAYDFDFVAVGGSVVGAFEEGELVMQHVNGVIASGRACLTYPTPAGPLPQPLPTPTFAGLARVQGTFIPLQSLVGQKSGATIATPTFSGGLAERDRYKLGLDYTEFRAFFLMGIRQTGLGEFGMAFDVGPSNAFDAAPHLAFYDGFALTEASLRRGIWNALNDARAAGVGFDLVLEP